MPALYTETLNRGEPTTQEIFLERAAEIKQILSIPQTITMLTLLPVRPRVLDLMTGTGAGLQALSEKLKELGNPPIQMVCVDDFATEDETPDPTRIDLHKRARYSLSLEETKINVSQITTICPVDTQKQDGLVYLQSLLAYHPLPFDLITGFSIPQSLGSKKFQKMLEIIYDRSYSQTFFTFGSSSWNLLNILRQNLKKDYFMRDEWKFYMKPKGIGPPDWDRWIMTNTKLALPKLN